MSYDTLLIAWWILFLALSWWPCCCYDEPPDCGRCSGTTPETLPVELNLLDHQCDCSQLRATFALTNLGGTLPCDWELSTSFDCGDGTEVDVYIYAQAQVLAGSQVRWWLTAWTGDYPDGTYYDHDYDDDFPGPEIDCTAKYTLPSRQYAPNPDDPDHCSSPITNECTINPDA